MASLKLAVQGMTCGHCRVKVEQALQSVAGTYGAQVEFPAGEADVEYDAGRASPEQYLAAVKAAGYTATIKD
jgi:copper chaperone